MLSTLLLSSLLSTSARAEEPTPATDPAPADPAPADPAPADPPSSEAPPAIPAPAPAVPVMTSPIGGATFDDGLLAGRSAALETDAAIWLVVGGGSGCLLGAIGCGGATVAGALIEPELPKEYRVTGSAEYQNGFIQGYEKKMKAKQATNAFIGGTVTTAVTVIVIVGIIVAGSASVAY